MLATRDECEALARHPFDEGFLSARGLTHATNDNGREVPGRRMGGTHADREAQAREEPTTFQITGKSSAARASLIASPIR